MAMVTPVQGHFSTGLFDACGQPGGCGQCCYVFCCLSCAYGDMVEKLAGTNACCAGNKCGACCLHWTVAGLPSLVSCLLTGGLIPFGGMFGWCVHTSTRTHLRAKYAIAGDGCNDCLTLACCEPCATVQELKEQDIRAQAAAQPVVMMAPVVMQAAHYAPQYAPQQPQHAPQQPQHAPQQAQYAEPMAPPVSQVPPTKL
eukprot:CAMPEP_0198198838 /NCGR_PEP_ID=MMETSP1445-20131203/2203_1 /TAXON_ID=36898 /ORGANISM="Pyramimonas sp., Strain CCMP2087" /LENGTH=198 /DNA_ID=CAMNT_0043868485 /DNA_START=113 /DNA_END=709 /DNA_ORIENTATION=+